MRTKASIVTKAKMSIAHKGKIQSAEHNSRISAKQWRCHEVIQYDLNGNDLNHWDSIAQASRALNLHDNAISRVCKGRSKTCGGFLFRYADDDYLDDVTRTLCEVIETMSTGIDWYFKDMFPPEIVAWVIAYEKRIKKF